MRSPRIALMVGFLSTLSLRRATQQAIKAEQTARISIHALLAESDIIFCKLFHGLVNFYPRSPCGERPRGSVSMPKELNFYPRSPCGERRKKAWWYPDRCAFLSTLSLRRATSFRANTNLLIWISIHALLAESDWILSSIAAVFPISIHALLAESDALGAVTSPAVSRFLSTLSLRRATPGPKSMTPERYYFYPRSPCGERHWYHINKNAAMDFYPRSPCGERPVTARIIDPTFDFYPRSPCGERHSEAVPRRPDADISIHALLAESDRAVTPVSVPPFLFLSTLSLRRATAVADLGKGYIRISIHALLAESDFTTVLH